MHRTICDFLLDIIQNSIEADASGIVVEVIQSESLFEATVGDDGCGMSEEELKRAQDPFYSKQGKHDHRKAGLGIPFLMQTASMTGGQVDIQSQQGIGTSVRLVLPVDHIDTPPVGDMVGTFTAALSYPGSFGMVIKRSAAASAGEDSYVLDRIQLQETLGELETGVSLNLLRRYIASQEASVQELLNSRVKSVKEAVHGKDDPRRA